MTNRAGCTTIIGIMTPTEAFAALQAGASALKLFPSALIGVNGFKALREVLPPQTQCFAVGGIHPTVESMQPWFEADIAGYGIGTGLFQPDFTPAQNAQNAQFYMEAWSQVNRSEQRL